MIVQCSYIIVWCCYTNLWYRFIIVWCCYSNLWYRFIIVWGDCMRAYMIVCCGYMILWHRYIIVRCHNTNGYTVVQCVYMLVCYRCMIVWVSYMIVWVGIATCMLWCSYIRASSPVNHKGLFSVTIHACLTWLQNSLVLLHDCLMSLHT